MSLPPLRSVWLGNGWRGTIFAIVFGLLGIEFCNIQRADADQPVVFEAVVVQLEGANGEVENQFVSALKGVLRKELRFVQKVCQPSPEQLNDIRQAGMVEVQEISKLFAREPEHSLKWPDGRKLLCDALAKKIDAILPEQASRRYRDELASREQAKQDAVVAMMVSIIDGKVNLSSQQADQVDAAIRNSWKAEWSQSVVILQYPLYAPLPETKTIAKILTPDQLQVLNQSPNHGRIILGWQAELGVRGWANGLEVDDE